MRIGTTRFAAFCALLRLMSAADPAADSTHQALLLARSGNCNEALAELKRVVAQNPHSVQLQNALAVCQTQTGHSREAATSFEIVARLQPGAWQAWNNLGASYLTFGKIAEAESAFRRAVRINPSAVSAWANLGFVLWKSGQRPAAFHSIDRAHWLSPEDTKLTRAWAEAASQLASEAAKEIDAGHYRAAAKLLCLVQQPLETTASWNNLIGYAEFKLGDDDSASKHLQRAIELDPNDEDYLLDIGDFLASHHAYDQARLFFAIGAERMPDSPRVLFGLAVAEILQDRRAEATARLKGLLHRYPRFQPAYRALGECYEDAGNWAGMDDLGKKLLAINPANAVGWYLRGASLEQMNNSPDTGTGISYLRKAVDLDPHSSRYHFRLGKAYAEALQSNAAIRELKEAIRIDPQQKRAHYVLARLYQKLDKGELAQREFKIHAQIKGSGSQEAYAAMVVAVRRMQNPQEELSHR